MEALPFTELTFLVEQIREIIEEQREFAACCTGQFKIRKGEDALNDPVLEVLLEPRPETRGEEISFAKLLASCLEETSTDYATIRKTQGEKALPRLRFVPGDELVRRELSSSIPTETEENVIVIDHQRKAFRGIGIFAHVDAGKTTITEQLLALAGAIPAPGSVDRGTAKTDDLEVERRRGISVRSASVYFRVAGPGDLSCGYPGASGFCLRGGAHASGT